MEQEGSMQNPVEPNKEGGGAIGETANPEVEIGQENLADSYWNPLDEDFSEIDRIDAGDSPDDETPAGKEAEPPDPSGEKETKDKKGDETKEGKEKEGDDKEKDEGEKEKAKEEETKDKPPTGHVPLQALHEERSKRQAATQELYSAKERIAELEQKLQKGDTGQQKGEDFSDFKVLSDEEFRQLWDDDPREATLYQNRLIRYQRHQAEQETAQHRQKSLERERKQIVQSAREAMETAAPEVFDPASDMSKTLTQYAAENGLSPRMAALLTDPQTEIQTVGEDGKPQKFILGHGAAEMLSLIANTHKALNSTDVDAIRKQVEEETAKRVREEVTRELTQKFKNSGMTDDADIFQSLGDATPAGETNLGGDPQSEAEWLAKPEAERMRLLGG